jgi:hypothetical protein
MGTKHTTPHKQQKQAAMAHRRRKHTSLTGMIRRARDAGERGQVSVKFIEADGTQIIVTSSKEPEAV